MSTPRLPYFLRLYRVRDWLHFLPLPLATFDPHGAPGAALLAAARGIASAFALLAFGYLLNSVADRRMDLDARKNPLIIPGAPEPRYSLAGLLAASLLLAACAPWPAQLATLLSLIFFSVYSTAPRIKSIPIAGSLANVGMFAPLLLVGMQTASLPPRFAYLVLACSALVLEVQLVHEAADQIEDRAGGVHTTWLTVGPRRTALIAAFLGLVAAVAAARIAPGGLAVAIAVFAAALFSVAFPLLLAQRGRDPGQAARLRIAHRWCGVVFGAALFVVWRWGA